MKEKNISIQRLKWKQTVKNMFCSRSKLFLKGNEWEGISYKYEMLGLVSDSDSKLNIYLISDKISDI